MTNAKPTARPLTADETDLLSQLLTDDEVRLRGIARDLPTDARRALVAVADGRAELREVLHATFKASMEAADSDPSDADRAHPARAAAWLAWKNGSEAKADAVCPFHERSLEYRAWDLGRHTWSWPIVRAKLIEDGWITRTSQD